MFQDWNGDGRVDSTDEFLEYQMMHDDTFDNGLHPTTSGDTGCLILLIVINVILGLMDLFTDS